MHGCGNYDHIRPLLLLSDVLRRIIYIITSCISGAFISEFPQLFQHLYTQQCRTCLLPVVIWFFLVGNAEGWKMDKFQALLAKIEYSLVVVCVYTHGVWVWVIPFSNTTQKTDLPQAGVVELWTTVVGEKLWLSCGNEDFSRGDEWEVLTEGWAISFVVATTCCHFS